MSNDISMNALRSPPAPVTADAAVQLQAAAAARTPETKPPELARPNADQGDPKERRQTLEEATERLNRQMSQMRRDLSFSVDDVADKIVVTVKNRESGEVVRQIPSETALRVAQSLDDMKGLLEDQKS